MRKTKKQAGITLIALIVTIVILLILAGISIGILTGDNGLIKNLSIFAMKSVFKSIEKSSILCFNIIMQLFLKNCK